MASASPRSGDDEVSVSFAAAVSGTVITDDEVVERQPLRQSDDPQQTHEVSFVRPSHQDHVTAEVKDFMSQDDISLCPSEWFQLCWIDPDESSDPEHLSCCDVCWKVCFLMSCLPCCYACYLTRTLRHQHKHMLNVSGLRPKSKFYSPLNSSSETHVVHHSPVTLEVNVIFIETPTSHYLQRFNAQVSDEVDGNESERLSRLSRKSILLRPTKLSERQHREATRYRSTLGAVHENETETISVVVTDTDDNSKEVHTSNGISSHSRWNQLSMIGNAVSRFSRSLSRTSKSGSQPETTQKKSENEPRAWSVPNSSEQSSEYFSFEEQSPNSVEKESLLRVKILDNRPTRQRGSSQVSMQSTVYYSFDDEAPFPEDTQTESDIHMKSSEERTRLIPELDVNLLFSVYNETSVPEWKNRQLKISDSIPSFDIVVVAVRRGCVSEIESLLRLSTGMMSYITNYWSGFYPLLLIEVQSKGSFEDSTEYTRSLNKVRQFFHDVHHIKVSADDNLDDQIDWMDECLARLYIHNKIAKCSESFSRSWNWSDECPGGCGLRKRKTKPKLSQQRRKLNSRKSFKRS